MTINRRNSQESVEPFEGAEILKMADSSTGSKMMSVVDLTVKPGTTSAYHRHPNTEESIFVVEGDVEFRVGNHKFKASPGDCILAPKGVGHGLANIGNIDARFICGYPNANPLREEIIPFTPNVALNGGYYILKNVRKLRTNSQKLRKNPGPEGGLLTQGVGYVWVIFFRLR